MVIVIFQFIFLEITSKTFQNSIIKYFFIKYVLYFSSYKTWKLQYRCVDISITQGVLRGGRTVDLRT